MGTINPDKIKQIQDFIKLQQETLSHQEFLTAFKQVVDYVKKSEQDLGQKIDVKLQEAQNKLSELQTNYSDAINKVETDNQSTISNVKKWALEQVGKLFIKSKINDKISEVDAKLKEINSFTPPDVSTIAVEASKQALEAIKPLIPDKITLEEELPKLGASIRDGLELLQGGERLDKSAIKGLEEELVILRKSGMNIGGGLSIPRTIDIANEVPSGVIDGINTVFNLAYTSINGSVKIFRGGARQQIVGDYTISGTTITFLIAPQPGEIIICDYKR